MLSVTGSGVNGSVARRLLAHQCDFMITFLSAHILRYDRSTNLNIITAPNRFRECKNWFNEEGYIIWSKRPVAMAYSRCVKELWVGEKPISSDESEVRTVRCFSVLRPDFLFHSLEPLRHDRPRVFFCDTRTPIHSILLPDKLCYRHFRLFLMAQLGMQQRLAQDRHHLLPGPQSPRLLLLCSSEQPNVDRAVR
jgi:hypothetical protein